ncbi:hypothetical protein MTR67_005295 [Solanum verrucosum]|uniref:Uncharacterized protein n=1 Tax=Solanum verrucosum TaxID=315347 RepID=A0AAF0PZA1_SOLVR|nr:hypothetical protein MTR67_005295 [Solanum verrucosum]
MKPRQQGDDELEEIQNASIQIALFANSQIKHFTHMDMRSELDVDLLKQKSAEYARAKDLGISHQTIKESVDEVAEEKDGNEDFCKELEEVFCLSRTTLTLNNKGELV